MILTYPNNTALMQQSDAFTEVAKQAGCVPLMVQFGDASASIAMIRRAIAIAGKTGLPLVLALAPPVARGALLLRDDSEWFVWLGVAVSGIRHCFESFIEIAAVLVDQECWDVRQSGPIPVAARTNEMAAVISHRVGSDVPIIMYRFGDQQSYHYSTYGNTGQVLEARRLPVSVRCYEPTPSNSADISRVFGDQRYSGRKRAAWFASAGGCGYIDGRWTNDRPELLIERAKSDGLLAAGLLAHGTLDQAIVYPHPLTPGAGRMECFDAFCLPGGV